MNTWQILRQLQYLIRSRKWTSGSKSVFHTDSVKIIAGASEDALEQMIMPACLIVPSGATSDPQEQEEPDMIEQEVGFVIGQAHHGDSWGEYRIVGGQRTGQTDSDGRGILELEEELFAAIELLDTDSGVVMQHRASSAARIQPFNRQTLVTREYLFRAWVTADRFYHPVINLQEA